MASWRLGEVETQRHGEVPGRLWPTIQPSNLRTNGNCRADKIGRRHRVESGRGRLCFAPDAGQTRRTLETLKWTLQIWFCLTVQYRFCRCSNLSFCIIETTMKYVIVCLISSFSEKIFCRILSDIYRKRSSDGFLSAKWRLSLSPNP